MCWYIAGRDKFSVPYTRSASANSQRISLRGVGTPSEMVLYNSRSTTQQRFVSQTPRQRQHGTASAVNDIIIVIPIDEGLVLLAMLEQQPQVPATLCDNPVQGIAFSVVDLVYPRPVLSQGYRYALEAALSGIEQRSPPVAV